MITNKINSEKIQKILGAIVVIILIGLFGWYVVRDISPLTSEGVSKDKEAVSNNDIDVSVETEGGDVEIKEIPKGFMNIVAQPKLYRVVVMPERFSPEAVAILQNNIDTLTSQLKEDSGSFQAWSDLANQYKIIDDFTGAVEIWEYLSIVAEGNIVSRINLGEVYHYYLKEYGKSEAVFNEVIAINKGTVGAYTGLHELYRYSYKTDTTLAIDILKDGIVAVSDNIDLLVTLAGYYRDIGMIDDAKTTYIKARDEAEMKGNTSLVNLINEELTGLE